MECCKPDSSTEFSNQVNDLDGLICYCFKYSKKELHKALKAGVEQEIIEDIKMKMKDPGCFCETANPSGKCCLSDILRFVDKFKR